MTWHDVVEALAGFILGASGIGAFLNYFFNKKLERFKSNIQTDSKLIENYGIRRHNTCAEIYKLIRIAQGSVTSLHGFRRVPSYADYDASDFDEMLKKLNILNKQRSRFVSLFKEDSEANIPIDKNRGVKAWREYEPVLGFNEARTKIQDARNELVLNELFLSSSLRQDFYKVLGDLDMLAFDIEHESEAPRFGKPDTFKKEKEIGIFIDGLVDKISNEISMKSNP